MNRFKPYPKYKDSGVEWLGEIPAAWDCAKIVRYAQLRTGGTPDRNNPDYWVDGNINWMASGEVNKRIINEVDSKITEKGMRNSNASMLPVDSVMIALNGQGRTKGMSAILKVPSTCNQSLAAFICDERRLHCAYLFYYLESRYRDIRGLVGEQRDGLSLGLLKEITTYLPPVDQQRAIATFLDRETGKIDVLVAKKERLIELLQEKRTAFITRAVTKGLDPNVQMKDSGVKWLGEIPAHWKSSRISELTTLLNGYPFNAEYFVRGDGTPLVRIRDLYGTETEVNYIGPVVDSAWIELGDVIIGMDGDFNVARWRGKRALLNQRMCCIRPRTGTDSGFIAYVLPLPLRVINDLTYSTTVKHLSSGDVRKIRLGSPPPEEQRTIAAFLDRETARIDALVAKVRDAIERLKELRTALVSAAVTGKIDVRGEVAS